MTGIQNPEGRGQPSVGWVTMTGVPKGGNPVRGQGVNDVDPEGGEPASAGWDLMTIQIQANPSRERSLSIY